MDIEVENTVSENLYEMLTKNQIKCQEKDFIEINE